MRATRLQLRAAALVNNARCARQAAGAASLFAMVKADGYGHGLEFVGRTLAAEVDGFGVACLQEAHRLRAAGVDAPLMLLEGPFAADEIAAAAAIGAELVIHSDWQLALLEQAPRTAPLSVWLKVDTGMHRLGLPPARVAEAAARLRSQSWLTLSGLVSHFASADQPDDPLGAQQLACVQRLAAELDVPFSAANSAALLRYPASRGCRVRPGIMLYGSSPLLGQSAASLDLLPTQQLLADVIAINDVPTGDTVGYGGRWRAPRDSRIAVVSIGYGDGYPRHAPDGTPVAIQGVDGSWHQTTLTGRVSMDMLTVDVTDLPAAQIGSTVELWGDQVSVDDVAAHCQTISYELFCRLTARPRREYC